VVKLIEPVFRVLSGGRWSVALALASALGAPATAAAKPEPTSPYLPFDQMARVLLMVEQSYVEPADRERLVDGAMRGMVSELDPHSSYMSPSEFAEFQSDTEGQFAGIGVEVDVRDDRVTVVAPIEGSPAARAGVLPGDQILAVNGRPVRGTKIDRIVDMMRGPAGTKVRVLIGRPKVEEPFALEITRAVVKVASVEGKRLDKGVAYVRLKQFQETTHEELLRVVGQLRKVGPIDRLLLDMRFNPGGLVDQAELVADELLSSGVIYSTRHRGKVLDMVQATPGGALSSAKVVVLVNEYSASAAELVAGALQDHKRATIVGTLTFGKGSVQTIFELPGGAGLRLTTMRYYTPNARAIQAQGIDPDVLIRPPKVTETIREQDLAGHLEAEVTPTVTRPGQEVVESPAESTPTVRLADIPSDPSKGKDFALSKAFEVLLR
jgi:carboxyl-terminal processing protease